MSKQLNRWLASALLLVGITVSVNAGQGLGAMNDSYRPGGWQGAGYFAPAQHYGSIGGASYVPTLSAFDDPVIVFVPPEMILLPPPGFGSFAVGTIVGFIFDLDFPYIVLASEFSAFSVDLNYCFVLDVYTFPFTYDVQLPTGEISVGFGLAGAADFQAYWDPVPLTFFRLGGIFDAAGIDYNGNFSAWSAGVFIIQ